ncbi:MAG: hypothetical protein DLM53_02130 [Candidatus Eremiobacter antarcticus]|nr:class I SAM-dependent methyltransferase [Candidatus Eremiobacteraeota bacterium]MBC5808205.1 class I SAM-dependent methyltransferase [Candidatus Eremiobacteraeota bacterium]PZR63596.1 MAG: hypothetical protein DLM53_02130 [Candidatus Eremiobacter sp. RRmetagenome_bin22]
MRTSPHDAGGYDSRSFVAEFYDFVPAYSNRPDAAFYLDLARAAAGATLELGCGTGRLLIPIARAGVEIVGLDRSQAMLQRCRQKLETESEAVRSRTQLVNGDMTDFELKQRFQLVIAPFRCFQHVLAVERQIACLRCVRRQLAAGGTFVLDVFQVQAARMHDTAFMQESVEFEGVALSGGRTLKRTFRTAAFHRGEQYNDCELIYYVTKPDGGSERLVHAFPLRYFFRYEVEHLLARSGFAVEDVFGDYDRSPLADDSPEMIFVAKAAG